MNKRLRLIAQSFAHALTIPNSLTDEQRLNLLYDFLDGNFFTFSQYKEFEHMTLYRYSKLTKSHDMAEMAVNHNCFFNPSLAKSREMANYFQSYIGLTQSLSFTVFRRFLDGGALTGEQMLEFLEAFVSVRYTKKSKEKYRRLFLQHTYNQARPMRIDSPSFESWKLFYRKYWDTEYAEKEIARVTAIYQKYP